MPALEELAISPPQQRPLQTDDIDDPRSWLEAYAAGVGSPSGRCTRWRPSTCSRSSRTIDDPTTSPDDFSMRRGAKGSRLQSPETAAVQSQMVGAGNRCGGRDAGEGTRRFASLVAAAVSFGRQAGSVSLRNGGSQVMRAWGRRIPNRVSRIKHPAPAASRSSRSCGPVRCGVPAGARSGR